MGDASPMLLYPGMDDLSQGARDGGATSRLIRASDFFRHGTLRAFTHL